MLKVIELTFTVIYCIFIFFLGNVTEKHCIKRQNEHQPFAKIIYTKYI